MSASTLVSNEPGSSVRDVLLQGPFGKLILHPQQSEIFAPSRKVFIASEASRRNSARLQSGRSPLYC